MSISSITITIVCLLIVAVIIVLLIRSHFEQREIVVGLKFNDDQKELTVTTKTVGETENIRIHKYAELTFKNKKLTDGMNGKQHNTITLIKGPYMAGHIYTDHFTWDSFTQSQMLDKLKLTIPISN